MVLSASQEPVETTDLPESAAGNGMLCICKAFHWYVETVSGITLTRLARLV